MEEKCIESKINFKIDEKNKRAMKRKLFEQKLK